MPNVGRNAVDRKDRAIIIVDPNAADPRGRATTVDRSAVDRRVVIITVDRSVVDITADRAGVNRNPN